MTTPVPTVQPGSFLTLHYRLTGPDGDELVNTFNDKPATLSLGAGELSPAMEQRLLGLAEGTRTTFDLPAGEAFGERNADMQQWVARKLLSELGDPDEKYNVGDVVQFPTPDGLGSYAGAVLQVREVAAGEGVGYNAAFVAPRSMRVGVVSLGYADGFLRARGPGNALKYQGEPLALLGKVSMDMVVIDLSSAPTVGEGDWVDVPFDLPVEAARSGLSQYELLTTLGRRLRSS